LKIHQSRGKSILCHSAPKAQSDFRPGQRPGEQYFNHLNALQGQLETCGFIHQIRFAPAGRKSFLWGTFPGALRLANLVLPLRGGIAHKSTFIAASVNSLNTQYF
jgi:hypothetical protein